MSSQPKKPEVQGEGDYAAARRYRKDVGDYVDANRPEEIEKKAKDAERAVDGAEGEDLRRAEAKGAARARK